MAKNRGVPDTVYKLNDQQFSQWANGKKITPAPITGSGCLLSLALIPLLLIGRVLGIRRAP